MGLVCIKGVRGDLCSGYLSSCSAKLDLEFLTLPGIVSRYEGHKCAIGQIGVEGWVNAWIFFATFFANSFLRTQHCAVSLPLQYATLNRRYVPFSHYLSTTAFPSSALYRAKEHRLSKPKRAARPSYRIS